MAAFHYKDAVPSAFVTEMVKNDSVKYPVQLRMVVQ